MFYFLLAELNASKKLPFLILMPNSREISLEAFEFTGHKELTIKFAPTSPNDLTNPVNNLSDESINPDAVSQADNTTILPLRL